MSDDRLLKIRQVCELVSVSKSTIWQRVKAKTFPAPVKVGSGTFWKASDVQNYIKSLGGADARLQDAAPVQN